MKNDLDHAKVLLEKSGNDLKSAEIGLAYESPMDTVAFHVQQAAEKLIKALLASQATLYPKTHDLKTLLDLVPAEFQAVHSFRDRIQGWTSYAVDMRYEIGGYPERQEVAEAIKIIHEFRAAVLQVFPSQPPS